MRSLRRNRLQTLLATVGMTIGVGTVLVMIAVGSGARRSITSQVRAAGMNIVVVNSGNYKMPQQWTSQGEAEEPAAYTRDTLHASVNDGVYRSGTHMRLRRMQSDPAHNPIQSAERDVENLGGLGAAKTLSLDDAAAIAEIGGVQAVSGGMHDNTFAGRGNSSWLTQLRGEQASLPAIRRAWVMTHGRFFTAREDDTHARVAVLGSVVAEHLFGVRNPVGEDLFMHGIRFRIIGVIASGSWMVPAASGDGQFDAVYVPVHVAQDLLRRANLDSLTVSTESTGDVTRVSKVLTALLRERHHLGGLPDDFTIASEAHAAIAHGGMRTDISRAMMGNANNLDKVTLEQLSKTLEQASRTMAMLLASVATVSLVVGGIGIMNIMLLSVTERTREIGIRRAVGAQSLDMMQQFLMEALILSLGGGVLGIALGAVGAMLVTHLGQWSVQLSPAAIVLSFTVSATIGIAFGYYPAQQASRVSPMTSLRYE